MQVLRYCVVGGTGYVVNLVAFLLLDRSISYTLAFELAFVLAATSNFVWNRIWTFQVRHGVRITVPRGSSPSARWRLPRPRRLRGLVEAGRRGVPRAGHPVATRYGFLE